MTLIHADGHAITRLLGLTSPLRHRASRHIPHQQHPPTPLLCPTKHCPAYLIPTTVSRKHYKVTQDGSLGRGEGATRLRTKVMQVVKQRRAARRPWRGEHTTGGGPCMGLMARPLAAGTDLVRLTEKAPKTLVSKDAKLRKDSWRRARLGKLNESCPTN